MAKLTKANQSLSPAAEKALFQLGSRVRRARIARRWTLADLSERMFVTPATVRRLELGHPGTSLGVLVTALSIFGLTSDLDRLAALDSDRIASMRAEEYQPKRVRTRNPTVSLDF
ncbi:helix-turn-helix domain-containing protein [Nevskia ramosa]|uniref:helix-turn-helix domain-containing protein n=1 Tax=Nevskia ramosa TaxID=64002 RepID=UPI0023551963|nr:helix-turn-helix transcriptional regulator [Nevskia ramosa]